MRGQLVVTFQTDMMLPQQIDNILMSITGRGGDVVYMKSFGFAATRDDYRIPGSVSILAGDKTTEALTITVAGSKNDVWYTYRQAVTTVPKDRIAELRMPIQWLCNESAEPELRSMSDGKGGVVTRVVRRQCEEGFTCKAGACEPVGVSPASLPDYAPSNLFGGAAQPEDGACFDVLECMGSGTIVTPDAECSIPKPDGDEINVALRVAGGGICDGESPTTTCFVPLDGQNVEGWMPSQDGTRLNLPKAVCTRLAEHKVLAVYASTACRTKLPSVPPCGVMSSVPDDNAQTIRPDPEVVPSARISPEVVARLPLTGDGLCCPLMSDSNKLYTCMCARGDDASDDSMTAMNSADPPSTLLALDPASGVSDSLPVAVRTNMATAVFNQTLYWASDDFVYTMPLRQGAMPVEHAALGGVYKRGVLLADELGFYVLTSGVNLMDMMPADTAPVQLLQFGPDGTISRMDPLGDSVIYQFTQDAGAFYAAVNRESMVPQNQPFERVTSVVRIDKVSHNTRILLNERRMTITDRTHSGYLGVLSDGTDVFALFETPPVDGVASLQIGRVRQAAQAAASDLEPIFELPVSAEPYFTSVQLLGAEAGAVLFSRSEFELPDPDMDGEDKPMLRSASVLLIPPDGSVRYVADFLGDGPLRGVAAIGDRVFWLNQSGRVYGLNRAALQSN